MSTLELRNFIDALHQHYQHIIGDANQEALSSSELISAIVSYYEDIISCMPGNVYWLDKNAISIGCNKNVLDMFGLQSVSQFKGLTFEDTGQINGWSNETIQFFKNDTLDVIRSGKPKLNTEDPPIKHRNGKTLHFLTSRVPLFDTANNVIGVVGISIDISEIKTMQAALNQAKQEAEAASQFKSEFVANMSHDVKTPLSGIIGMAELLTYRLKKNENLELAQTLLMSGRQLLNFFDNCLEVFKLENGDITLVTEYFNLQAVMNQISELFQPAAKTKGVHFSIQYQPNLPHCFLGSCAGLYRILLNLVGNAVKFTHQGKVTIHISVEKMLKKNEALMKFIVEDTGIGIPADKQSIIFERFTRLTPSYVGTYEGSGIGLYIVQKFITSMQGEIKVHSTPGKGSQFIVKLPFKVPALEEQPHATQNENSTTHSTYERISSPKILLIEDNLTAQLMQSSLLSSISCEVTVVENGEKALEAFKPGKFDLIFLDIGLPDIQGDHVSRQIRQLEQQSGYRTPIIALTAHATQEIHNHCIEAGIDTVFSKPLSLDQAKHILNDYLK